MNRLGFLREHEGAEDPCERGHGLKRWPIEGGIGITRATAA